MENLRWTENCQGTCYECGKPFPTKDLQEEADKLALVCPGSRRAATTCINPSHNYGAVAMFPGDYEYGL